MTAPPLSGLSSDAIESIARAFHDAYEEFARAEGWETQESTRVAFDDLPEANRRVMLRTVLYLVDCGLIT